MFTVQFFQVQVKDFFEITQPPFFVNRATKILGRNYIKWGTRRNIPNQIAHIKCIDYRR